jgi:DNA (cytosine-5)-methyltransferase 1
MKNSYITVTDQFCGAGGSSQGVRNLSRSMGGGLEVKLALNHWKLAIETHNTNFPDTLHECTDISACDPRRYPKTNILITSPECTNHSLAKGKKRKQTTDLFTALDPEAERSRATMWDVPRFAEYHNYEIIIVENVVDARSWVMWDAWLKAMHLLGYDHKCVYYNSMHAHPTPQSRDRMYVVFWKRGNKAPDLNLRPLAYCTHCTKQTETYQWFKKTDMPFGKYRQQYVYRCPTCNTIVEPYYYAAFNCIDWSIPGTRIGDRKKPLSDKTVARIQYGIEKYWNNPQIITSRYSSGTECRVRNAVDDVMPTQPGDSSHGIFNPLIVKRNHTTSPGSLVKDSANDPLPTQLTDNGFHILSPLIMNSEYGYGRNKVRSTVDSVGFTQTTRATNGVLMPIIVENKGTSKSRTSNDRLSCITGVNHHALLSDKSLQSFIAQYYGGSNVVSDIKEPVRTFSTKEPSALIMRGEKPSIEDCYYRMLLPHEVKAGMAFDQDYVVLGSGKDQVKQLGNAVTPPVMQELTKRCIETLM